MVGLRAVYNPVRPRVVKPDAETKAKLKMLRDLNDAEEYSAYNINAPLTICVYNFRGSTSLKAEDPKHKKPLKGLQIAGQDAIILCNVLRKMGEEAYVFHGEFASCVCVGGYTSLDDSRFIDAMKRLDMSVSQLKLEPQAFPRPVRPSDSILAN
jgi:hypothetical protein